jgi:hypothetical protein
LPERYLEDMEDAVEIGREHASPFVLGPINEGLLA